MNRKALVRLGLIALIASFASTTHAQTYSVIHEFSGTGNDGSFPYSGVTLRNGALYGTTHDGGSGCGTVYQLTQQGSGWVSKAIYVFHSGEDRTDGCAPFARVVFGPDAHLYGTTFQGGDANGGLVFELVPPVSATCITAACQWKQNVLHAFRFGSDGSNPEYGDLVWDPQGNIYGTTSGGTGKGTAFQMTKSGNSWTETPLYQFNPFTEGQPANGVTLDGNGNVYGTTEGLVFELAYPSWSESVLLYLGNDTGGPSYAGLVMDNSGNLYGATNGAGSGGAGTVFELSPVGNVYIPTVLYNFSGDNGCGSYASLTMDPSGNLYGTTYCTGASQQGVVFKLTKTGNTWAYTSLHDFTGLADEGGEPMSQVTIDSNGTLYGTTTHGGPLGTNGVVWMIKP
jgi:uncharacterized repeat protein (TIGR03803 family)